MKIFPLFAFVSVLLGAELFAVDKALLFDFSQSQTSLSPVPAEEQGALLSMIFTKFLKDDQACPTASESKSPTEDDFKNGTFKPTVLGHALGSFTAAGVEEVAYLISMGECSVDGPALQTNRLAILSKGKVRGNFFVAKQGILKVQDLDGDGQDELLLGASLNRSGATETTAGWYQANPQGLKEKYALGLVYRRRCKEDGSEPEKGELASLLYGTSGKTPFLRKNVKRSCPDKRKRKPFKQISVDKPL